LDDRGGDGVGCGGAPRYDVAQGRTGDEDDGDLGFTVGGVGFRV